MQCNFETIETGCKCLRCGRLIRGHNGVGLQAECKQTCKYLGNSTHETINVICKDCKGNNTSKSYLLHSCSIHIFCIPNFRCTDTSKQAIAEWQEVSGNLVEIQPCLGCPDFIPEKDETS